MLRAWASVGNTPQVRLQQRLEDYVDIDPNELRELRVPA